MTLKCAMLLMACAVVTGSASAANNANLIQSRLDQARGQAQAEQSSLQPCEKDLLFLADFETEGQVFADKGLLPVDLAPDHYRPGKFGRGFFFEKPSHNLLPAAMADVESGTRGFQATGTAQLACADAASPFGKKALAITVSDNHSGIRMVPVKVSYLTLEAHEKTWTLLASTYVKGPAGTTVRIQLAFTPCPLPQNKAGKPGSKTQAEEPRIPDNATPVTVKLTGNWQRIACWASCDRRSEGRTAVFSMRRIGAGPVTLLADGFQFEQARFYPHHHLNPTTWTPGGQRAPATFARIASPLKEHFPVDQGTFAFWTRTPQETNFNEPGGIQWISFGAGWAPNWSMSTYRCTAGGEGTYTTDLNVTDGQWHHMAMTWDKSKGRIYRDGVAFRSFDRKQPAAPPELERYVLLLGGSISDGQAANSILDDVALFRRALDPSEILPMVKSARPLRATAEPAAFSLPTRRVFYRNESEAPLDFQIMPRLPFRDPLKVDLSIGDVVFATQTVNTAAGAPAGHVAFDAGRLKCGTYTCRIGSLVDGHAAYLELPVDIVPELPKDRFLVMAWGESGETGEARAFFKRMGINAVDTYATNIEQLGREGFVYGWHYNFGQGDWSPTNRQRVEAQTRKETQDRARFPNWRYTLLNSETGPGLLPDPENRRAWFDTWTRKELGSPIPPEKGWKFGSPNNPDSCWFAPGRQPDRTGRYQASGEMDFMKWWTNRGGPWWRLNADATAVIHRARPDVKCWTDPLWYPGQAADLEAGGTWSYQVWGQDLVGEFEQSYACVRGSEKEFYATLGGSYVSPLTASVTEPDGLPKHLAPTGDDLVQQAWLAVTQIASDGIAYWDVTSLFNGARKIKGFYTEPGSVEKLGEAIKSDLVPLATMLKGVPNAPRPVALLLPESTLWMDAGEGGWCWGISHYSGNWKNWLGKAGIPYDVILDHNVTPGLLAEYKVVIFPMALYVRGNIHRELTAAGKSGTEIIVDRHCRQHYPNMTRWDVGYYHQLPAEKKAILDKDKSYGKLPVEKLTELAHRLAPQLAAYAKGEAAGIFYNRRESGGIKYISVVNDRRQPGPYTKWTNHPEFQPYGQAQRATVWVKAPPGSTVYEFTQSRKLPAQRQDDHLTVAIDLPPHGGRLLCIYPGEIRQIRANVEAEYHLGHSSRISAAILDEQGKPVPGRQLVHVTVETPHGEVHDESGFYRANNGQTTIPFRPAANDPPGQWRMTLKERTSGLTATQVLQVAPERP